MYGWVRPARQAFDEARQIAKHAVRLAPSSPETNQALALMLWATGESEQAVTAARRAIELNPNYAEAYVALGLALTFTGELEEGLAACKMAERCNPRDTRGSRLYDAMGHVYFMLGDYEQAIEVSKKCSTRILRSLAPSYHWPYPMPAWIARLTPSVLSRGCWA